MIHKKLCSNLLCAAIAVASFGQTLTDSNLPIVIINTDNNASIPDAPRILANMKIIYKGVDQRNSVSDQNDASSLNYNGRINIEIRGSSSQFLDKKQYGLTTLQADNKSNNNVSLLGMPQENDWILNGFAFEPGLIRDPLSFYLSRAIGEYAPRTVYCEVIINGNYKGLYALQEKIKVDDNRVNIRKIEPMDNALPDISGGYIIKADKVTNEDPFAWKMSSYLGANNVDFIYEFPKPSNISVAQGQYIQQQFFSLASVAGINFKTTGFPSVIDVPSFINFMLINELAANVDAYQFSTFFHKDKRGKLRAGPLWDLNLTYGNDLFIWNFDRSKTYNWQFDNGDNVGAKFWKDLFNNSTFRCYMSKRWHELTQPGQPLHLDMINSWIDQTTTNISEAALRENARWGTIGNHASRINSIKNFISERISWITTNLGEYDVCANVTTPALVISSINYHPPISADFPSSSDQEFVEITNNSGEAIDMSGVYFSGTGFNYQFPNNYIFPPHAFLQLANKLKTFEKRYNLSAFGEFTRNLNNNAQSLTLADAYGNVIDHVSYSSELPWPNVSGNGFYLKLKDLNSDNSDPINWEASNETIFTNVIAGTEKRAPFSVFPNPFTESISIQCDQPINSIIIRNFYGQIIRQINSSETYHTIDLKDLPRGIYLLTLPANSLVSHKLIKQ